LLAAAGQQRDAEVELLAALDQVPTYADAALALADLWRVTGRSTEAMHVLIEMLERDISHSAALLALGELLFDAGRRRDAACAFARLASVDPDHAGALYYQGAILAEQHRYREAIEQWDRVIALEPEGLYGRRARHDRRSAADLARILVRRGRGQPGRAGARTPAAGVVAVKGGAGRVGGGGSR
jgi:tetratricopeptide (TPR) repeat protein